MGQDLPSYLDGLLYSDYLTYWDYIHLDTLLSLQNPRTGFPERNTLLSASVFANDCTTADAYATAFMVMGKDRALQLAAADSTIDAYLIYSDDKGEMKFAYTDGVKSIFEK